MGTYTEEKLARMSVHTLRVILRTEFNGVPGVCNKNELISQILSIQAGGAAPSRSTKGRKPLGEFVTPINTQISLAEDVSGSNRVKGVFELNDEGYGYVRVAQKSGDYAECFVSKAIAGRYGLCTGDIVEGDAQYFGEFNSVKMNSVYFVNGKDCEEQQERVKFSSFKSEYAISKMELDVSASPIIGAIDLFCPLGKGQRCIVEDAKGKHGTEFVKTLLNSFCDKKLKVILLSAGVKPETLSSFKNCDGCELVSLSSDNDNESVLRMVNMTVERAKRLTSLGNDVVLVLDSLSYFANVYSEFLVSEKKTKGFIKTNLTKSGYAREIFGIGGCFGEDKSLTVIATFKSESDEKLCGELIDMATSVIKLNSSDILTRRGYVVDLVDSYTDKDDLLLTKSQIAFADGERKKLEKDVDYLAEIYRNLAK